jgi:hypothetical protein
MRSVPHAMLQKVSKAAGKKTDVFAQLPINKKDDSELHKLAADGVSCTVCHQISDEGLGTRENFNANFTLRPTPPDGNRVILVRTRSTRVARRSCDRRPASSR